MSLGMEATCEQERSPVRDAGPSHVGLELASSAGLGSGDRHELLQVIETPPPLLQEYLRKLHDAPPEGLDRPAVRGLVALEAASRLQDQTSLRLVHNPGG